MSLIIQSIQSIQYENSITGFYSFNFAGNRSESIKTRSKKISGRIAQ
jgi:hypothetical protein